MQYSGPSLTHGSLVSPLHRDANALIGALSLSLSLAIFSPVFVSVSVSLLSSSLLPSSFAPAFLSHSSCPPLLSSLRVRP